MKAGKYFSIAFEAIGLNKVRAALTMLGIVIGVFSVIVMIGLGEGSQAYITQQVKGLGAGVLVITPGNPRTQNAFGPPGLTSAQTLTMADAKALEAIPGTLLVSPNAMMSFLLKFGKNTQGAMVVGSTASALEIRGVKIARGRTFTEQEARTGARVIVLGPKLADALADRTLEPILGAKVKIETTRYRVIGITASQGGGAFGTADDTAFMPVRSFQGLMRNGERVNSIFMKVASEELLPTVMGQVEGILRQRHGLRADAEDDFKLQTQADLLQTVTMITGAFTVLLAGIAAISLVVGGIGIMNIMLVSVTERTREIGIRKAVGAKHADILVQFLIEAGSLSLAGGTVGIALAMLVTRVVTRMANLPFVFSPAAIAGAFAFSAAVGIFFGLYPAAKAARLDPVEALRYE